jgi:hypothetical protein
MMTIDDAAAEALKRSFLLGTARNPPPIGGALHDVISMKGPAAELAALVLVGQRMRFRRHYPPSEPSTPPPSLTTRRKIVPDAARPLMRRLVATDGGSASDVAAFVLADTCDRLLLRPHPFDLPRLTTFIRAHHDFLGAHAAAWAKRNDENEKGPSHYFDADTIDASNWTTARPAARSKFIIDMRGREPDRARELVAASFAADPAAVRVRLLDALARGLSPADVPFLESLAKDRAPSVRERAQQLLKYIPGTAAAEGRIRDLVARTKVGTAGLLRRRKTLSLELPATLNVSFNRERRWAVDEYAGVGLDAIAAAFGLSVADMVTAATDDRPLLALFARQASLERRFDVLAAIVREHAADAWIDALPEHGGVGELPDDATIEQWCAAALAPGLWSRLPEPQHLASLYGFLRRPLPPDQARELLRSRAFATIGNETWAAEALAALIPASLRSELRRVLAALPADEVSRALLLLDCLALLDPSEQESL